MAARIDLLWTVGLEGVPLHEIGQQGFIICGERRSNGLFKGVTLVRHQIDPKSFCKSNKVAPRVAVPFGKLIDELLYARRRLGHDLLVFSLPQRHFSTKRTF
jgi:hypothetical protein